MLLAIDIGNTQTVFSLCNDQPDMVWRLATDASRTEDEYASVLLPLFERANINAQEIEAAIVSSVVPDANFPVAQLCKRYFDCEALIIGREHVHVSMPVDIDNPKELGADRLVNAYAAWEKHQRSLIIVDFGTATTFDVVDEKGCYVGGAIAPGVNLSLEALSSAAAKLHGIAIKKPQTVIGRNTTGAMQSGVYYGYMGLIEGIIERMRVEMKEQPYVIATGGLAKLYAESTDMIDDVDTDLTVRGLQLIYEAHKKANG